MSQDDEKSHTSWYVIWTWGGPDGIATFGIVSLALMLFVCTVTDWGFGAGILGLTLGFLLTLFAFTSNHFRMSQDGKEVVSDDCGCGMGDECQFDDWMRGPSYD